MEQSIDDVDLTERFEASIVFDIFIIYASQNTYNEMIDSCIDHYTNSDMLFIPIGKIVQHLFEKIKLSGYENFIWLYEILVSHTIWVLEPRF